MSMPACQPLRRRPNSELTGPSTGQMNSGGWLANSGLSSTKRAGGLSLRGWRRSAPSSATALLPGITSFWPARMK